jgi:lipopolysaccharide biosynthesis glycosyltransferase
VTRLDIACASEGAAYVVHTAAMVNSVIERNPGHDVRVHWLHGPELPERLRRRVEEWLGERVVFHHVPDDRVEGLPTADFTRKATWYRIFLPELLPGVERVLQLDSDLLATDSLAPLWELELGDHHVAAVSNVLEPEYRDHPAALGLPEGQAYFNAGVLLMNLEAMRRDGCSDALLAYGRRHQPMWRDQDALNAVLGTHRLELHPRWNVMNIFRFTDWAEAVFGAEAVEEARRDPGIRHFEGPDDNKPWHLMCERDGRELYFQHRRGTPWPRVRREGVTPRNVARKVRRRVSRS